MLTHLVSIFDLVAGIQRDHPAILWGDRRISYGELQARFRRFAGALRRRGFGCRVERSALEPWESGQDHVALYLHNGNEYLEALLGSFAARCAAVNVNYRYVEAELGYLLRNSASRVLCYHATFAPIVSRVRGDLPGLELLIQVADASGEPLLDGAIDYRKLLAGESAAPLDLSYSSDDLFIIYTGGTTGFPKGVLWRQEDIFYNLLGGMPFMHGAGVSAAFNTWHRGGTIVLPEESRRLDPHSFWEAVARHGVDSVMLIGDAFALPLIQALRERRHDVSSVRVVTSTAAVLSASVKAELVSLLPEGVLVIESVGSTEAGLQAMSTLAAAEAGRPATYEMREGTVLLDPERRQVLDRASAGQTIGWTARAGNLPLGYLGDRDKTVETFPTIDGVRYAIAGDRAHYDAAGRLVLLGRESMCVNTGGEKVYVEEVERIVKSHPAIFDTLVVGRPSERWGQEVTAVVSLRPGKDEPTVEELRAHCSGQLAGYKLPRAIVVAPAIVHLANGKPDYAWAKQYATTRQP